MPVARENDLGFKGPWLSMLSRCQSILRPVLFSPNFHRRGMSSLSSVGKGCLEELKNLTDFSALLKSADPVLVDFSATYQDSWCGPCKMLSPILEEVARKNQNWHFVKVDVDKFPSLANDYNVTSVPYVALFKSGKVAASFMGAKSAVAVQKFLDDHK